MGGTIIVHGHKENQSTHCAGCGIVLQSEYKDQVGFIPEQALQRDPVICHRCYRMRHYNEASTIALDPDEFLDILHHVSETNSLVVNIIDIFDFEGSLMPSIGRFAGNNPLVLVVNKVDLLPKSINRNRLLNWIQKQAKDYGLRTVEIVLCSAKKNIGMDRLIEVLDEYREGKDVYVVGATNVGKSTLINRLIRDYSELNELLTTSRYPGTTLDLIKIPLDDGKYLVDTPGIVHPSRLTECVTSNDLHLIMPEHEIKPSVYQLKEQQTLFFGALARFDFVAGKPLSCTCFISNRLNIHRTKLDHADTLYEKHKGDMLAPPRQDDLPLLPPLVKHTLRIAKGDGQDVVISGLGWIKVTTDQGATLDVYAPKGVKVLLRQTMI